ncbi:hypothetical protein [Luteimonas sp. RIT-PG2_3]|jgi:hypothetical protein
MHQPGTMGTPDDYSDTRHRVYFEIGEHAGVGQRVIERFLQTRCRDLPGMPEEGWRAIRAGHGYQVDVPIQLVPEIVRALAQDNVAVYQVVRIGESSQLPALHPHSSGSLP